MSVEQQRELARIRSQRYRDNNREAYNEQRREYREKNKDRINAAIRERRKESPDKFRKWDRDRYIRSPLRTKLLKYKISEYDYLEMVESQKNLCAICGEEMKRVNIDHCHKSDRVRGLLCTACNTGIGKLKDSPDILLSAINYLTSYLAHKNNN